MSGSGEWEDGDHEARWRKPESARDVGEVKPIPKGAFRIVKPLMRAFSAFNVWAYRKSGGRVLGTFQGAPVCLVTMTGCRTGKERTIPLIHLAHGDDVLLVASQGGTDFHPIWYRNIMANPDIVVQDGKRIRAMRARRATDDEKRELWAHINSIYRDFDEYQERTQRNIPVLICSPVD